MSDDHLFDKGIETRRAVLGAEYVDGSLGRADDFMMGSMPSRQRMRCC
jgi:4-carboxymuconolactone decarboxylase